MGAQTCSSVQFWLVALTRALWWRYMIDSHIQGLPCAAEGKSKGTASLHNLSTVDSVSSVQRVANLAGVGALPHNFGPASNTINYGAAAPHMVLPVQDKDSAEIYATKE